MWTTVITAVLTAILKWGTSLWDRWRSVEAYRKMGRLEATAETNTKTQELEHEMAKVDASPASADDVTNSLRDGKF